MAEIVSELTNGEFCSYIKEGLVVIDFFAEWCMPCVMMGPIVEDLAEEFDEKVKFGKINIDDESEIASKYAISSVPTFLFFKEGEVIDKVIGAVNQEELEEIIKKHL